MTAANLIVRERAAYLLTDTAALDVDGRALCFESKVVSSDRLRLAITRNGMDWDTASPIVAEWMDQQADGDQALSALPALMTRLRSDLQSVITLTAFRSDRPAHFNLFVAMWSPPRRRAEGYIIASHDGGFAPNVRADHAYQTAQFICPKVDRSLYPSDPEKDALALLETQRARLNPHGRYTVGGAAQLTVVNEAGVSTTVLWRWPDELGRPINPQRNQYSLSVEKRTHSYCPLKTFSAHGRTVL